MSQLFDKITRLTIGASPQQRIWKALLQKPASIAVLERDGEVYFSLKDGLLKVRVLDRKPSGGVALSVIPHDEGISAETLLKWGADEALDFTVEQVRGTLEPRCNCPSCSEEGEG
jgi:hypothetical protein